MQYRITRSSDPYSEKKPCLGAKLSGKDRFGDKVWKLEINTLEELKFLRKETGSPLIFDEGSIEIYDSYREG